MKRILPVLTLIALSCAPLAEGPVVPEAAGPDVLAEVGSLQLETSAYRDNVLMRFENSESQYREVVLRSGEGLSRTDVLQAENELYFALNKSNVGEHELAERLFAAPRRVIERHGTAAARVKSDVLYAQHLLNKSDADAARDMADWAIELGTRVLAGKAARSGTATDRPLVQVADITPEVAALLGSTDRSQLGQQIGLGRLSERERLAVYLAQGHYAAAAAAMAGAGGDARAHLDRARELLAPIPERVALWLRAEIARLGAVVSENRGELAEAERDAARAVRITRQFAARERPEALARLQHGRLLLALGDEGKARSAYHDALETLALGGRGVEYDDLAPYLALLSEDPASPARDEEAFLAVQQLRNPVTSETLSRLAARLAAGDSTSARAIRALQDSEREANQLEARLDILTAAPERDVHAVAITRTNLAEARAAQAAARSAVREHAPNYGQISERSIPLERFQGSLNPGELFLQARLGGAGGILMAITPERIELVELDLDVEAAEDLVARIRDSIYNTVFDVAAARELYIRLLGPLDDLVHDSRTVTLAPDGPLLSLPPGILVAGSPTGLRPGSVDYSSVPWLGTRKAVSVALSASSLHQLRQAPASGAPTAFHGFGDFETVGVQNAELVAARDDVSPECREVYEQIASMPPLPGTGDEVRSIARLMAPGGAEVTMGAGFSDTAVKKPGLSKARTLHFATHALLPMSVKCLPEPALVTSHGGPGSDAMLQAGEVVELELDADLVVLSACDTGGRGATSALGTGFRAPAGEALSGLVRAFFYAGARNLVASHWLVPDEETIALMEGMYRDIGTGETLAHAMQTARTDLARNSATSHPFYWAAFSVIGDGARATQVGSAALN